MYFIDFSFSWIIVSLLYLNSQKAGIICYVFYVPKCTSCSGVHEGPQSGRDRNCLQVPLWIPTLKSRYETTFISWNQHPKNTNKITLPPNFKPVWGRGDFAGPLAGKNLPQKVNNWSYLRDVLLFLKIYLCIYLAARSLTCGTWDLQCGI